MMICKYQAVQNVWWRQIVRVGLQSNAGAIIRLTLCQAWYMTADLEYILGPGNLSLTWKVTVDIKNII